MSVSNTHLFFCITSDCGNTAVAGTMCAECMESVGCPDCGDTGATSLGSGFCHACMSVRNHPCNTAFVDYEHEHTGRCWEFHDEDEHRRRCGILRVVDPDWSIWCGVEGPCRGCGILLADGDDVCEGCRIQYSFDEDARRCTCDGTGRMCDLCAEEYAEPCRGCGVPSQLWTDNTYCRKCYVERYGDEFPKAVRVSDELKTELLANLPAEGDKWSFTPAPPPRHTSLESMRAEIAEIEARLKTNMTKGQKDDWIWVLQNRRGDLAAAEKEMWEQYDEDDLRKLDLQNRRGF